MLRNLRLYRVDSPWPDSPEALTELLQAKPFAPCSAYAERNAGWVSPGGRDEASLCYTLMGADLLQLRTQSRVLPPAAIREVLADRVEAFTARVGTSPPRREMKKLKEEVRDELLPQSLLKSDHTHAVYLPEDALLVIGAATAAKAEWFIDHLRFCFPSLACHPATFAEPVAKLMKKIFMGQAPSPFRLGRECRMQDPSDAGATGAWRNVELDDAAIRHHVMEGFRLTHLGVGYDEFLQFVLSDEGVISKFRLAEGQVQDQADDVEPAALMDAELAVFIGMVRRLVKDFVKQLGPVQ